MVSKVIELNRIKNVEFSIFKYIDLLIFDDYNRFITTDRKTIRFDSKYLIRLVR